MNMMTMMMALMTVMMIMMTMTITNMILEKLACYFHDLAVLFGTKLKRKTITTASGTDVTGTVVLFCDNVTLLGVTEVIRSCSTTHVHRSTYDHC